MTAEDRRSQRFRPRPAHDQPLGDPRDRLPRAVHGRARRDDRQRRAAVDPARARTSRPRACRGWSTPTRSMFGGFLLLGGRAADLLGRKRLFVAGIALFSAASLLNGLAQSLDDADRRARAPGARWRARSPPPPCRSSPRPSPTRMSGPRRSACGARSPPAAAPSACCWAACSPSSPPGQWIFIVNVPVGIAALLATLRFVPESRADLEHRTFDLRRRRHRHQRPGRARVRDRQGAALGLGLGADDRPARRRRSCCWRLFVAIERRSRAPLMRLEHLPGPDAGGRRRRAAARRLGMFGMFFFASLYVQDILGYSPLRAGLAFLPVTAGIVIGAGHRSAAGPPRRRPQRRADRDRAGDGRHGGADPAAGPRHLRRQPAARAAADEHRDGADVRADHAARRPAASSDNDAGLASGLFNTAQQVGGSLGLAILADARREPDASLLRGSRGRRPVARPPRSVSGYHVAFAGRGGMLGRRRRDPRAGAAPPPRRAHRRASWCPPPSPRRRICGR